MLRFSLELLDFIELDLLIDESIDWDNMPSFDIDVFCDSCFVLADYFSTKKILFMFNIYGVFLAILFI